MITITSPLISIIIPVYNIYEYLPKCMDSILYQSYGNFEVLLINDGSTDGSEKLCKEYAEKDLRVKVFHKKNGGVSTARNLGLQMATGEWITFVDGDDELYEESLKSIIGILDNNVDWYVFNSRVFDKYGNFLYSKYNFHEKLENITFNPLDLYIKYGYTRGSVWGCLYKNAFIKQHNICFLEGIVNSEDDLFVKIVHYFASSVTLKQIDLYRINEREGSASRSWTNQRLSQYIDGLHKIETEIDRLGIEYCNTPILNHLIFGYIYQMVNQSIKIGRITNYFKIIKVIKQSRLYPICQVDKISSSKKDILILNFSIGLYIFKRLLRLKKQNSSNKCLKN